jgi:molybdopterin/thiamine biosynthesis adenylyltransferase
LIDGDRFEESNFNRQLLCTGAALGQSKVEAAGRRLAEINPSVEFTTHAQFLSSKNADSLIRDSDLVVDCLDNLKARFALEAACRKADLPFVSAAVAGSTGHVTTIFPADPGLRLIYGEPQQAPLRGAETTLGTVPHAVAALAAVECSEAIKIIQKKGVLLRKKMLILDLTEALFDVIDLC